MHAPFEAVSIFDPLSNLAHSLLAFLFSKTFFFFFFEVKFWRLCPEGRSRGASGSAGRHEDEAERTSSQAIWLTQGRVMTAQSHNQGSEGRKQMGTAGSHIPHLLSKPVSESHFL